MTFFQYVHYLCDYFLSMRSYYPVSLYIKTFSYVDFEPFNSPCSGSSSFRPFNSPCPGTSSFRPFNSPCPGTSSLHTHPHTHTYANTRMHIYAYMHTYMHTHTCIYIYLYTHCLFYLLTIQVAVFFGILLPSSGSLRSFAFVFALFWVFKVILPFYSNLTYVVLIFYSFRNLCYLLVYRQSNKSKQMCDPHPCLSYRLSF